MFCRRSLGLHRGMFPAWSARRNSQKVFLSILLQEWVMLSGPRTASAAQT